MEKKLPSKNPFKKEMLEAEKALPDLDIYCYDSKGKLQGTEEFRNNDAADLKKIKLFEAVKTHLKGCTKETKFDAWLGDKPGKGKEIKFSEKRGLTGKSSIFKLFCDAFGGASKLKTLLDKQAKDLDDLMCDYIAGDITDDVYNDRIDNVRIQKTTICIRVVE